MEIVIRDITDYVFPAMEICIRCGKPIAKFNLHWEDGHSERLNIDYLRSFRITKKGNVCLECLNSK